MNFNFNSTHFSPRLQKYSIKRTKLTDKTKILCSHYDKRKGTCDNRQLKIILKQTARQYEDNPAKRRAILLTSIGNCFRVLKDLAFPDAPNTKRFDQLATLLLEHLKPTRLKIAERYRFHSAVQQQEQSIADFVRE